MISVPSARRCEPHGGDVIGWPITVRFEEAAGDGFGLDRRWFRCEDVAIEVAAVLCGG